MVYANGKHRTYSNRGEFVAGVQHRDAVSSWKVSAASACLLLASAGCHSKQEPATVSVASSTRSLAAQSGHEQQSRASSQPTKVGNPDADGALPSVVGPVELSAPVDVITGQIQGFPRVVPNAIVAVDVASRINASLDHDEAAAKATAMSCRADLKEALPGLKSKDLAGAWQRSVDVTMKGPRFLSYTMTTNQSCGGAYPELGRSSSIVYDLMTGKPVNWLRLLPNGTKGVRGDLGDGQVAGWIQMPSLQMQALQDAEKECKEVFDSSHGDIISFEVYPDARSGSLRANTPDIMHARRDCEATLALKEAELRALGAPPELWQYISAAHALQQKH
jgi:hypothetical protein